MKPSQEKHALNLPSPRTIRRACANELYRTIKRLKIYVPANQVQKAVELYTGKVIGHLEWITRHHSNRKLLSDWWDESVCGEIAELWNVDRNRLSRAFRDAFGG